MPCNHETNFGRCPITELATHSPRMMNDHNHAHTPNTMWCPHAYEMQLCHSMPIPCHVYDECYMHNTHASFGQSYQLTYNFQINHTIHVNILYTHILTSTSHHQSSNDLPYTLGLIVTPCPQIAYNQAM